MNSLSDVYGSVPPSQDVFADFNPAMYIGCELIDGRLLTEQAAIDYWAKLSSHILYVREAGAMLGLSNEQMLLHDRSKLSYIEFPAAAMHFNGGGAPEAYSYAWLNHWHSNPHHWHHYVFSGSYHLPDSGMDGQMVEMPEAYATEMVADWMGSERAYTGSWDMGNWLLDNLPKISIHRNTRAFVSGILGGLGYGDIVAKVG